MKHSISIGLLLAALTLPIHGLLAAGNFSTEATHAYLVDMQTNTVLLDKNSSDPMVPSSMSKLMTVYIVFEQLKKGMLQLDDTLRVSKKAWKKGGSKMFVKHNDKVTIEDLLRGIIVQSGNDACIVIAEGLAGTEEAFAEMMNITAQEIGLQDSHFVNATGWPDDGHVMSPRDLVTLSNHIIKEFPDYYHYFLEKEFTYNNIKQLNRNRLLWRFLGADGLKTGHTEAGGYGITVSAKRGDRRLLLSVNGLESDAKRVTEAERILNYGFRSFDNITLFKAGEEVGEAQVWFGNNRTVSLVAPEDITVTIPKIQKRKVKLSVQYDGPLPAPIKEGAVVSYLSIEIPGMEPQKIPLKAKESVSRLSGVSHILRALEYYMTNS